MVTGASGGLGEETARALAAHGAEVTLLARSQQKLSKAAGRIKDSTGKTVNIGTLELHRPNTIREFVQGWLSSYSQLDILINNAGIMMCPYTLTDEGWELQFATNHLGHFLLTNLLIGALKKGAPSRVVTVSSSGHHVAPVDSTIFIANTGTMIRLMLMDSLRRQTSGLPEN